MGKLLRRTVDGDELLVEWTPSDQASVDAAQVVYRHWLDEDYVAVQSDGAEYRPVAGNHLPVDAEQVILSTAMGGG